MAKLWCIRFSVYPTSRFATFPIDMLRYDRCCPDTQSSTGKIGLRIGHHEEDQEEISLVHYAHGNKKWRPTEGRWRSFGWVVKEVEMPFDLS